jgi:drug/metabolite transporter (DMT)-like permease
MPIVAINLRTAALTLLALIAFASNSLLTRLALGSRQIDAATFTAIRLVAGAVVLVLLVGVQGRSWAPLKWGGLRGPLALFAYAAPFSFAYLRIGYALRSGERPTALTWTGIVLATLGLAMLTIPAATRPDPIGLLLMVVAGVAWAVYTLVGKRTPDPLAANARSFLWSSPLALVLALLWHASLFASGRGVALALVSGGVTSGLGYAIWYRVLPRLTVTRAAVAQLTVPVIAALAAVALLHEQLSGRLVLSGAAVLSGVGLVLLTRSRIRA